MSKFSKKLMFFCFAALSFQVNAADKKLEVAHFSQDNGCWCGVAVNEMVEHFYKRGEWKWYKGRQANLAKSENNGGIAVGSTSDKTGPDAPCGPNGGVSSPEMLKMLNSRMRDLNFKEGFSFKNTLFHRTVIDAIDKGNPVILRGYTRYKDGTKKLGQHWYLIIGYKDADGKAETLNESDGYYIHDAAVGAGFSRLITLNEEGKFVSNADVIKHLTGAGNDIYYIVSTKN